MSNGKITTEHRVTKLESCVEGIQDDIGEIKTTINNHIPTSIKELDVKIDTIVETINKRPTWLMSLLIGILLALLGVILGHFAG